MDLSALAQLQQASKKSYNDQKSTIKKVLAGKKVQCEYCKQVLTFSAEQEREKEQKVAFIRCPKGCTDITLEIG